MNKEFKDLEASQPIRIEKKKKRERESMFGENTVSD